MSGDYTYDDNEGVNLSDTSSGENTATGLEGYDGDISPNREWPGITPNTKELVAKVDDMRSVVTELRNLADSIREASAVREVERASSEVRLGPQTWAGAGYLQQAGSQAAQLVAGGAKQVADNLDLAADAIESAADGYDNAEHSNQSGFDQ